MVIQGRRLDVTETSAINQASACVGPNRIGSDANHVSVLGRCDGTNGRPAAADERHGSRLKVEKQHRVANERYEWRNERPISDRQRARCVARHGERSERRIEQNDTQIGRVVHEHPAVRELEQPHERAGREADVLRGPGLDGPQSRTGIAVCARAGAKEPTRTNVAATNDWMVFMVDGRGMRANTNRGRQRSVSSAPRAPDRTSNRAARSGR